MLNNILADLVVVELASVLAGPLAGSFLSELGARVIKVENKSSNGDVTRQWKLPTEDSASTVSAYYSSANTGKEIVLLDLENKDDYEYLVSLIQKADIVLSNFQKRTSEKLKVDYGTLRKINNNIIFAQLTAYTYDDPTPGYDLVMQAEAGFISMNGTIDGELVKMPVAMIDIIAGHQLKEAILLGVISRMKTGKGNYVEVSLYKSAISALANQASNFLMAGHVPKPLGTLHPNIAPYGDIVITNDKIKVILAIGSDKQFEKLGKTLRLAAAFRHTFSLNKKRVERREELMAHLQATCSELNYNQFAGYLQNAKIPFCRITDLKTVFENPLAINMIIEETIEEQKTLKVSNVAFEMKS